MSVAKVTEITSSSSKSIEDAIETGIDRASKTSSKSRERGFSRSRLNVKMAR